MFDKEFEAIVAINTYAMLYKFDIKNNIYANSPNSLDFDGSALGYWKRRALFYGATLEELAQIEQDIRLG